MQLNSNSFSGGRASRPRPEPVVQTAGRSWVSLRGAVWVALGVMFLFAAASVVPSLFVSGTEPVQVSSAKPAPLAKPGVKARIKALFGPPRGQRLNG